MILSPWFIPTWTNEDKDSAYIFRCSLSLPKCIRQMRIVGSRNFTRVSRPRKVMREKFSSKNAQTTVWVQYCIRCLLMYKQTLEEKSLFEPG